MIQFTERDEAAYQEMITHLPLFAHPNPKNVLIIGGGDGGVLREVCRHSCVENVVMVEIDPEVCRISKKYFPTTMATAFDDPRVTLLHDDGAKFLRETPLRFDAVIVDSSDPVGPAESLFEASFFGLVKQALAPGGIMCTQGECLMLHLDLIEELLGRCGNLFPVVQYAYTSVPSYPSGQIGFIICSTNPSLDLCTPSRVDPSMNSLLHYYSPGVHASSFVLPKYAAERLSSAKKNAACRLMHSMKKIRPCSFALGFLSAALVVGGAAAWRSTRK